MIVIDGRTNKVVATLIGQSVIGRGAAGAAVTPLDNSVYVLGTDPTESESAALVIDGKTNTVTATIAVGSGPDAVATNSVTGRTYVANGDDNTVSVIKG